MSPKIFAVRANVSVRLATEQESLKIPVLPLFAVLSKSQSGKS
jgi:hypothetical protein